MYQPSQIEEALSHIEIGIRQLKIQYDMFFSGAMPRQPFESRRELEKLIKTVGDTRMQRFADRYRFNGLASKYQTMVELWNKMLRAKEEGRLRPGIPGFVDPVRRVAQAAAATQGRSAAVSRFEVSGADSERESLKMFYDKYLEASRGNGNGAGGERRISFERFSKQIKAKTEAIKKKAGCDSVSYSLEIKDGGVALKAKPSKSGGRGK